MISASLMCSNLLNISEVLADLESGGVDFIHYDIMDGSFVSNIELGVSLFNMIRSHSSLRMDVHFLTNDPAKIVDLLNLKSGDIVTVHIESNVDILSFSNSMHKKGVLVGLAINVDTPVQRLIPYLNNIDIVLAMMILPGFAGAPLASNAISHLSQINQLVKKYNPNIQIEVDGHVSNDLIPQLIQLGASVFVAGSSSIFKSNTNVQKNVCVLKQCLRDNE